jgi:hypothetical protein
VLDLGRRATEELARLGRELATRPLLREAVRTGRVRLRAAQTILDAARGEDERLWVERAETMTVRALEELVRGCAPPDEEQWYACRVRLAPFERAVLDKALGLARKLDATPDRVAGIEAIVAEFTSSCPPPPDVPDEEHLREFPSALRPLGERRSRDRSREAALEAETDRWAFLAPPGDCAAPDLGLDDTAPAEQVDARLRQLARFRRWCEDVVGWCALALKRARVHLQLGFASFRHYVEERLGLAPRAVEQRARVEARRWESPALREAATLPGMTYEKLRLLSHLPEHEIRAWTPRAAALTCIALRRALEDEESRQLRAQVRIRVPLPASVAGALAGALRTVRERVGRATPVGTCLALIAWEFVATWKRVVRRDHGISRKVRARDRDACQVPGCSHVGAHAHHVEYRSRGGGDELENQTATCEYHHLRCIHGGYLKVEGRAPDLRWFLGGIAWEGPRP